MTVESQLPLPSLLSQVLVAFTIEFDNEFEHRTPHRTSTGPAANNPRNLPWLVSLAMWSNFMRFVSEDGITVRELQRLTGHANLGMRQWLTRMEQWWGYVVVRPDPTSDRPAPPFGDRLVFPSAGGRRAQEAWRPLSGVIEDRWRARFGEVEIDALRDALWSIVGQFGPQAFALPEYLPILGYGLATASPERDVEPSGDGREMPLSALVSRALLAFALEYERESNYSLAIGANILRLLRQEDAGVRVRDLSRLSGVSKEAVAMALAFLQKRGCVAETLASQQSRTKVVRLTSTGVAAADADFRLLSDVEDRWRDRYGKVAVARLRESLERLACDPAASAAPLFQCLEPHADGWRAGVPRPTVLPHFPMVLHRGGFPDGA